MDKRNFVESSECAERAGW